MDSKPPSPPRDATDSKTTFRKPSNDVANRNYRRRSPSSGSSSSHGSLKHERSYSPIFSRGDVVKASEHQQRRKDDEKVLDRDSARSRYAKTGDSHRIPYRNSHGHSRHDDYSRHEKCADDEGRHRHTSSNSGRELKGATHSDHTRQESNCGRSRDYTRGVDKYAREGHDSSGHRSKDKESESLSLDTQKFKDKLSADKIGSGRKHANTTSEDKDRDHYRRDREARAGKRDYQRSFGDHRSDRTVYYEERKGYRNDSSVRDDGHRLRESHKNDTQERNGQKEKKKHENRETNRDSTSAQREQSEDESALGSENQESYAKKPKLLSCGKTVDHPRDLDEKQSSCPKLAEEIDGKVPVGPANANNSVAGNDLNAAKVAAMKAAELVNRNLVGVGFMSTEQKKKLLWGNKKSTTSEESGHRWDTTLFGDRERQEKFNKLMGVKGDVVEHKQDDQDDNGRLQAEKQKELQMDLEKQYTAGLRRRDGRTVGLGL